MKIDKHFFRIITTLFFLFLMVFLIVLFLQVFIHFFNQFLSTDIYHHSFLNNVLNPFIAIFIGAFFSVIVRSSSIFITLLAAVVVAGFPFPSAVFMVLGANIGTTFQSSWRNVIPDAQINDKRRMMTISSMHYFNNLIAFAVFFPLQISVDFLGRSSQFVAQWFDIFYTDEALQLLPLAPSIIASIPYEHNPLTVIILFSLLIIFSMRIFFIILRILFDPLVIKLLTQQIKNDKMEGRVLINGILTSGLLQSSSSTLYILMPLVRQITCNIPLIYSLILGINVGTCFTTILFAVLLQSKLALSIGLAHLFYNFIALIIFAYVPLLKELPILASRHLALCSYDDR